MATLLFGSRFQAAHVLSQCSFTEPQTMEARHAQKVAASAWRLLVRQVRTWYRGYTVEQVDRDLPDHVHEKCSILPGMFLCRRRGVRSQLSHDVVSHDGITGPGRGHSSWGLTAVEQDIEVPKILLQDYILPRTSLREPQLVEQLVEVPTVPVVVEQTVVISVPDGGGRPQNKVQQLVGSVVEVFKVYALDRAQQLVSVEVFMVFTQDKFQQRHPQLLALQLQRLTTRMSRLKCFFRTFPRFPKSAKVASHSTAELGAHSSSSTLSAHHTPCIGCIQTPLGKSSCSSSMLANRMPETWFWCGTNLDYGVLAVLLAQTAAWTA